VAQVPQLNTRTYNEARQDIRNGDVLMARGSYMFYKLIQKSRRLILEPCGVCHAARRD
jgi:uncharacterized protein with PhoU and TrkA domain